MSLGRKLEDAGGKLDTSSFQDLGRSKCRIGKSGILRKAKSTGLNMMSQLSNFDFKIGKVRSVK